MQSPSLTLLHVIHAGTVVPLRGGLAAAVDQRQDHQAVEGDRRVQLMNSVIGRQLQSENRCANTGKQAC